MTLTTTSLTLSSPCLCFGHLFFPHRPHLSLGRYVEFVKTRYISGDASVLMFGATACRQPMNAIRVDRDLRLCYTAPSETFGNPNLAPEECSPFPIDVLEVRDHMTHNLISKPILL